MNIIKSKDIMLDAINSIDSSSDVWRECVWS